MNIKFPIEFETLMKRQLGEEYGKFAAAAEETPVYRGIRINTLKAGAFDALSKVCPLTESVLWCADGFYINDGSINGRHPYHMGGLFYFQEPSAMCAAEALPVRENDKVLDLCAAPGGKTTQLAAKLKGTGFIAANEISSKRASVLSENIARMGITNAAVFNESPNVLADKYPEFFDKIIVDAPCSGEGMFRKEPDALTDWSLEHTKACARRQRHIIDSAYIMLKPGGYMVYSTCTFSVYENEEIVQYILENYPDMTIEPIPALSMLSPGIPEFAGGNDQVSRARRVYPHLHKGEGHFAALFKKAGEADVETQEREPKNRKNAVYGIAWDSEKLFSEFEKECLTFSVRERFGGELVSFGERLFLKPTGLDIDRVRVPRPGLDLGVCRKGRFEPSHALCLALKKEDFKNTVDHSWDSLEIERYLKGNVISAGGKGWAAVLADGFPIGWIKVSGGMGKNHLPK